MKKKIFIIIGIIVLIAAAGFIILKIMTKNAERHVETEKAIIVTARQLALAFGKTEDSANKAFLNKTLEVSGLVTTVDSNDNHQSVLLFQSNDGTAGVACTFKTKIENVQVGNTITCKGICTGFLSNVTITDCILINNVQGVQTIQLPKEAIDSPKIKKKTVDTIVSKKITTYNTSKAQIKFDAGGGVEDIKATNNQTEASISESGAIKFKVPMLGFKFSDALMQQHFNEEYVESSKFPTASFTGNIEKVSSIDFTKDGIHSAVVTGNLTMHGVTQKINTKATLTIKSGKLSAESNIDIKMADYKISTDATSAAVLTISCNF